MRWLERDGVKLYYEVAPGSGRPILLVHGWCCDHTYFAPQFEYFAGGSSRVVSVDLRGHGRSDKPEQDYTMQAFADDLAWLCGEIGLEKPVVIGHSMGGIVAFDLASRCPALPATIVMLDAGIVLPPGAHDAIVHFLQQVSGPDYRQPLQEYVANVLFIPTDDQQRKERILDDMTAVPQHVMVSAMEGLRDYDKPRADMTSVHELCPQLLDGKTVGSGHFCQLEVPEQINAMIARFLTVALPG